MISLDQLDPSVFLTAHGWIALIWLTVMEIVLGIDNIIIISILSGDLATKEEQRKARRLGLDYQAGRKGMVRTANGNAIAYQIKLDTVRLGGITLYGIDAVVMEGEKLGLPLLGMSFLNRLDMKREGDAMTLTKRF